MSKYELVVELAKIMSWPAAVVISVALLRPALSRLLDRIGYVKWRDLEVLLREGLEQAKPTGTPPEIPAQIYEAVARSPNEALLKVWNSVEQDLRTLAAKRGQKVPKTFRGLGLMLERAEIVESELLHQINALRQARNAVAHGAPVMEDQAVDFASAAYDVKSQVAKLLSDT